MADDALSGLGRRSALGLVGAAISGVATIGTLLVANRALDGQQTGQFFVALSVFAICQGLCSLGIDAGLQYWVPAINADSARHLIKRAFVTVTLIGVVAAVVVWFTAAPFADLVSKKDATGAEDVLRALAVLLPFSGLLEVAFGALRACDSVLSATLLDRVVRPVGQVVAMIVVAASGGGAIAMVYAWTLPVVVSVVIAMVLALRRHTTAGLSTTRGPIEPGAFWRYTGPRALARTAQVLTQRVDVILVAAIVSEDASGVYGTVSRCMIAGVFVATAVQQLVQPRLRKLVVRDDLPAVKEMYGASTTWLVIATWPAYLAMAVFAPTVLHAFGPGVARGSTALTILCLAMLVASACGLVEVVLLMLGRSWLSTVNVLAALAVNVALNAVLIPWLGMNGAAIAWMAAIFVTNVVPLYQVSRVGLHPGGMPLYTAMATAAGAFALPLLVGRLVGGHDVATFLVSFVIGLVVYLAALVTFRRRMLLDRFVADLRPRPTPLPDPIHMEAR
ncbi:MAG: polysaccharide biosynthesis protein [Ilumatobacteraceae bacterium]|nr:polysaccharide biosynthesis protein [Ilumatobacteraceae bacterium]